MKETNTSTDSKAEEESNEKTVWDDTEEIIKTQLKGFEGCIMDCQVYTSV